MQSQRGNMFIISAASGTGKTSLVHALINTVPGLQVSISHTTRTRRPHEKDGQDYHFIDTDGFRDLANSGQFLEYAQVFDHNYGTSRSWVEQHLSAGEDIILEIDWQGAQQIKKQIMDAVYIFILPPSRNTLESRLIGRGETPETVSRRMQGAINEISHYKEYDFLLINDDFDKALAELTSIIHVMKHGYIQQKVYYDHFVKQLLNDSGNQVE